MWVKECVSVGVGACSGRAVRLFVLLLAFVVSDSHPAPAPSMPRPAPPRPTLLAGVAGWLVGGGG